MSEFAYHHFEFEDDSGLTNSILITDALLRSDGVEKYVPGWSVIRFVGVVFIESRTLLLPPVWTGVLPNGSS